MKYASWTSDAHAPNWTQWLGKFKGHKAKGLEVGCFEGRSSNWFVENILTHPDSVLYCVDTFAGGDDLPEFKGNSLLDIFKENTKANSNKMLMFRGESRQVLPEMLIADYRFDFVYVDGAHTAKAVLTDCILSFEMLNVGGILIMDDYPWGQERGDDRPGPAIDSFIASCAPELRIIHKDWQVAVERIA